MKLLYYQLGYKFGNQLVNRCCDQFWDLLGNQLNDELWKEINFLTWGGEVAIYVSGTADEDPTPSPSAHYGYQYSDYNDSEDDDLRIMLDDTDYLYQTDQALYGNRLFGEPKSILIIENLLQGAHTLRIYGQSTPTLYSVVIYGQNDDSPLPITLETGIVVSLKPVTIASFFKASARSVA